MSIERPEVVEDGHLTYLDDLRESGEVNMWGAGAYLDNEFGLGKKDSSTVCLYWMSSFGERHPSLDDEGI